MRLCKVIFTVITATVCSTAVHATGMELSNVVHVTDPPFSYLEGQDCYSIQDQRLEHGSIVFPIDNANGITVIGYTGSAGFVSGAGAAYQRGYNAVNAGSTAYPLYFNASTHSLLADVGIGTVQCQAYKNGKAYATLTDQRIAPDAPMYGVDITYSTDHVKYISAATTLDVWPIGQLYRQTYTSHLPSNTVSVRINLSYIYWLATSDGIQQVQFPREHPFYISSIDVSLNQEPTVPTDPPAEPEPDPAPEPMPDPKPDPPAGSTPDSSPPPSADTSTTVQPSSADDSDDGSSREDKTELQRLRREKVTYSPQQPSANAASAPPVPPTRHVVSLPTESPLAQSSSTSASSDVPSREASKSDILIEPARVQAEGGHEPPSDQTPLILIFLIVVDIAAHIIVARRR